MKTKHIAIAILFLILYCFNSWASSGILVSKQSIYPSYIKTPQDIEDWLLREEFKYKSDTKPEDEWKKPEQTIKDMFGDCEDLAILTSFILEDLGYKEVSIIAIYGKNLAHGITWFKEKDGTWSFFSTGENADGSVQYYNPTRLTNVFNILYYYFPEWKYIGVCTHRGNIIKRFYRKDIERRK